MGKKRKQRSKSEIRREDGSTKEEKKDDRSKSQSASGRWVIKETESSQSDKRKKVELGDLSPELEDKTKGDGKSDNKNKRSKNKDRRQRSDGRDTEEPANDDAKKVGKEESPCGKAPENQRKRRRDSQERGDEKRSRDGAKLPDNFVSSHEKQRQHGPKTGEIWVEKRSKIDEESLGYPHISKRIFENVEKTKALIVLNHPEKYVLRGKGIITCLQGDVNIFGFHITQEKGPQPVYSPESNSFITMETTAGSATPDLKLDSVLEEYFLEKEKEVKDLLCSAICPVVLLMEEMENKFFSFISTISPYKELFCPQSSKQGPFPIANILNHCGIGLYTSDADIKKIQIPKDYVKVEEWISCRLKNGDTPVLVICGGKDSGKSTLTRYLINRALNIVQGVAYMDCDIGQTEFTGPGCVSLTKVTEPLLGPPFTHQRKNVSCCFVGHLSPADIVEDYMICLEHVHSKYAELKSKCPLIVNTMGWNKGLGLILLARTLQLVKPNLVVQLDCAKNYKNMPLLTSDFIQKYQELVPELTSESLEEETLKESHKLISVNSVVDRDIEIQDSRYRAPDHRTLSLLANFRQLFENIGEISENFNAFVPYELPWKQVAVHVAHQTVPRSQIMCTLNASIVGLCVVKTDRIVDSGMEGYPKFLDGPAMYECLGLGLVRAIDPCKKVFYILTSLSECDCAKVNCLVRGAVDIPQQILMNQAYHQLIPYVGNPKDVTGATCVNRRRHMQRKSGGAGDKS